MEVGGGLVALDDGWWLHAPTGNKIGPNGVIYSESGEVIGRVSYQDDDDQPTSDQ